MAVFADTRNVYIDLATLLSADIGDSSIEQTVRDQLVTFLFAGHETPALALTYAIWLLSGRPIRERLYAELGSVCDTPTDADLPRLDLTERIIKEALRLYPPVYVLHRQPCRELTLRTYRSPANVTLQLATYGIQRDPRWTSAPCPEYAYFPFGGGPRHCIGLRFAMTELQLALATLTQRVEFERVTDTIDPSPNVMLEPGRVTMRIHSR